MKYNNLEMVQNILSGMNADEVNSVSDNAESTQVLVICRSVFYDMASELNLPEHHSLFELQASGDSAKPTIMYRPDTVHRIDWLKYNCLTTDDTTDNFRLLTYVPIEQFIDYIHQLKTDDDTVDTISHTVNGDSITLYARNDTAPTMYSTFDDSTIIFDAYDSTVDTTLQKTKTLGFGPKSNIFTMTDDFIAPFDEQVFALYYNECKALAWAEMKEMLHQKAEQTIKRQRRSIQKNKDAFATKQTYFDRLPNYGRR